MGLLALLLVWPAVGFAQGQDAGAEAYEVQRGDTLWGLAVQYLASGRRWQDIHALNRSVVRDPNLIFPGQVLTLPSAAVAAVAERPVPSSQE
ncbi:MAG: LysM peptidoglycan-binding domain-containing protein, partial [Longimicrobiales bacterium]